MSDSTNTRQEELKNCPLCGKQPKLVYLAGWEIICLCGVNLCLENPGKAPLITAWNTRSGDSGMGDVAWISEVFPDWTTLQILASGEAYAFNRETGRVYKLPHPDCPFFQFPPPTTAASQGGEDVQS